MFRRLILLGKSIINYLRDSSLGLALDSSAQNTLYQDGAIQFTAADKAYLSIASNTSIRTGNVDFSFTGWVYMDTIITTQKCIVSKAVTSGNREYSLSVKTDGTVAFTVYNGGSTTIGDVSTVTAMTTGTWYFIYAYYDSAHAQVGVSINNENPVTANTTGNCAVSTADFCVGANPDGTGAWLFNGRIDSLSFQKYIPTTAERTALYNSGNGRMYADLTAANGLNTFATNLTSWWGFNEENGVRYDAKGTNHLNQTFINIVDSTTPLLNGGFETLGAGGRDVFGTWTESIDDNAKTVGAGNLTSSGTTCTLSYTSHGYLAGQVITVSGANETAYNGSFAIATAGANSFTYTAGGTPSASPATGTITFSSVSADTSAPHTGTYCARLETDASGNGGGLRMTIGTSGHKYMTSCWIKRGATSGTFKMDGDISPGNVWTPTTSYAQTTYYFTSSGAGGVFIYRRSAANNCTFFLDDIVIVCNEIPSAAGIAAGLATDGNLCASFNGTSQSLAVASNASLSPVLGNFSCWAWVNLSSLSATTNPILGKWKPGTNNREYSLSYLGSSGRFAFLVSNDGTASTTVSENVLGQPSINVWYLVVAWYDGTNINISVNNNAGTAAVYSSGTTAFSGQFTIATLDGSGLLFPGRIDGAGFMKRVITPAEITSLYNNGKGVKYSQLPSSITAPLSPALISPSISNGGFETAGAHTGMTDIWANWTGSVAGTSTLADETTITHSGGHSAHFFIDNAGDTCQITNAVPGVAGKRYKWTFWMYSDTVGTPIRVGSGTNTGTPQYTPTIITANQWMQYSAETVSDGVSLVVKRTGTTNNCNVYIDDLTVEELLLISFWNLDEYSAGTGAVTRNDSIAISANNLTDTGTTPSGQGVNYYEGTVSKWIDLSTSAKNFTQTTQSAKLLYRTNIQSFKPVVTGDNGTKYLTNAADLIGAGDVTVLAVIKPRGYGGSGLGRIIENSKFSFRVDSTSGGRLNITSTGTDIPCNTPNGSIVLNTAYVVGVTRLADGTANLYINGVLSGNANQASGTTASGTPTNIFNIPAGTRGFDGDIDEILLFKRILSLYEIAEITTILRTKWGV